MIIKTIFQKTRKATVLALVLIMAFTFSVVVSAMDMQFQVAPKEKITKFYETEFKHFYDSIPVDIQQKHTATIAKVDERIKNENMAGAITSKATNFDLDYYAQVIKIGIVPYADDVFKEELRGLVNDIDKYTVDWNRLEEHNRTLYGEDMPTPTTFGKSVAEDSVRISLNGSGYNVTNAVSYARTWTQNGTELRNSNYNYYAGLNDCTNFVSQVLHDSNAGGIAYVHNDNWGLDYDDPDNWYYENNGWPSIPSWTWGGARNLYDHLSSWSSNVRRLYYWSDVQVGDIVSWDTNGGSFSIEHQTVVTKIQSGVIYLTYHTTDKEDEPISTLLNAGYTGYAWAINH